MTVSETTLTVDEGSSGTYVVRLNTEPSATVTVAAAEDDNRVDETVNPSRRSGGDYGNGADGDVTITERGRVVHANRVHCAKVRQRTNQRTGRPHERP